MARDNDATSFHSLDESFHQLITEAAGMAHAFDLVQEQKAHVDRICVLSLTQTHEMQELVNDHMQLLTGLANGDRASNRVCVSIFQG